MKRICKGLPVIALLLLLCLGFTACSSKSQKETASLGNEPSGETAETTEVLADGNPTITTEDVTLEIYCGFAGGARQAYESMADMDLVKQMEAETGITLKFVHPPESDDGTFFTTMIASGKYPDIIWNTFASYPGGPTAAMDDGVIIDATPLIEKYAVNFNAILDSYDPVERTNCLSDDGRYIKFGTVFSPPYLVGRAHGGFLARKDLLDKAGITELPETIEEYEAMFDAFLAEGINPWTTAMTQWQYRDYSSVASAFGVSFRKSHLEDGKVVYSRTSPEYKEFLEVMNRWYTKGYLTSDSLMQLIPESQKTFQAGNAGAILAGSWEIITLETVGKANNPDFEVVGLPYPKVNKGDSINTFATMLEVVDGGRAAFVSTQCKYPEEAVKFIDYLYRPETIMMTAWGVNTDEYTLWTEDEKGTRSWTEFMTNNPDFDYEIGRQRYTANALQGAWEEQMERLQYDIPQVQQAWSEWAKNTDRSGLLPSFITQTTDEARELSQLLAQIETYGDEMTFSFITGETPLDEFDSFVQQLKSMGTDRVCELQQAAYDRYLAR